jgi:hypothetical protein
VTVWLREESEHTVPGFCMLYCLSSLYGCDKAEGKDLISSLVPDDHFRRYWVALGNLLHRQWWYRIWAVQEICLAQEALVVCGKYAVDWADIQKSTAVLLPCLDIIDELMEATVMSNPEIGSVFHHFRRGISCIRTFKFLSSYMNRSQISDRHGYTLDLLSIAHNSLASDPRDKVYAMHGLAEELSWKCPLATISVDCSISVCDIFMLTAQTLYRATRDVSFLNQVKRTTINGGQRNFNLLSWVPDGTLPTFYGQFLTTGLSNRSKSTFSIAGQIFCASRVKANCSFDLANRKVTIQGFIVGSIRQLEGRYIDLSPSVRAKTARRYGPRLH